MQTSYLAGAAVLLVAFSALAQRVDANPDEAAGRQLFQANCARCHGADAKGSDAAPNLLQRVGGMSEDRFVNAVLRRYSWGLSATEATSEDAVRDAMMRGVLQPRSGSAEMPAWQSSDAVRGGVGKIFRYLNSQASSQRR